MGTTLTLSHKNKINKGFDKGQSINNEVLADYKDAIRKNGCTVELTTPDKHHRNVAERANQTWKDHFISIHAGVDVTFPTHKWDRLISQATLTLNLLRQSNVSLNVSAYANHHGQFHYNYTPLAPMGCVVQLHEKPKRRKTFSKHAAEAGTSKHHLSIIGVTSYLSKRCGKCKSWILCTSSTNT
ncbi:hypothetical protein ACHAW6_013561 [Cyclotella cf. meneghiniana]